MNKQLDQLAQHLEQKGYPLKAGQSETVPRI